MPTNRIYDAIKKELPKVDGKVFAITGTTSGTGFVAARTVAEFGGEVLLLNRKSSRVEDSLSKLKEAVPGGKFVPIECDLQDFASVRTAAKEIKRKYDKIYCLSNNAGIMGTPDEATKDGYDTQMQTNHFSHFLLTKELFPLLEAQAAESGDARIVNHSSFVRDRTVNNGLERKYFEKNGGNLGGNSIRMMGGACFHRYFQTKLANSVFTHGIHDKLQGKDSKVRAICAHPGASNTDLGRSLNLGFLWTATLTLFGPFMTQTPEDGATGLIKAMMDPNAESGVLYGPLKTAGEPVPNPPKFYENDPEAIKMLWETSEEATGVKFEI